MSNNKQQTVQITPKQVLDKSSKDLQLTWDSFSKIWQDNHQQITPEQAMEYIKQVEAVWYLAILPYLESEDQAIKDYAMFNNNVALSMIDYLEKYIPEISLDKIEKISSNIKDLIVKKFRIKKNYTGQEYTQQTKKFNKEVDSLIHELSLAGHSPDQKTKNQVFELNLKLKSLLN